MKLKFLILALVLTGCASMQGRSSGYRYYRASHNRVILHSKVASRKRVASYNRVSSRKPEAFSSPVTSPALETFHASNTFLPRESILPTESSQMPFPYYSDISSGFGMRYHPILKRNLFHDGCDIPMPTGTPVYASKSGKVSSAGWKGDYGNTVEVRHSDGAHTRYAHLSAISVAVGKKVSQGVTMLGRVGSSGLSTGPHLHFEIVSPSGASVNPMAQVIK